jgi:hypothetical protein
MKRRRRLAGILVSLGLFGSVRTSTSTPKPRYSHSTVYANNTVYFLGGILSDTSLSTDFLSLDLSQEFNSSSPPWISLPSLPGGTANAAAAIGTDQRVYLLGGQTNDCSSNFLNVYDPSSSTWATPQFFGTTPIRRQGGETFTSAADDIIFYFGGQSTACTTGGTNVYNTLNAMSLQNSSWFIPANSNPPVAESDFALTKVMIGSGSTEQVLIIGGQTAQANTYVQMSQLGIFDMTSRSWTFVTATTASGQDPPEERVGHTAVTTADGKVVVYGGTVGPSSRAAVPQLAILDTSTMPFQWSTPNVGNVSFGPSAGLTGHSAIITGDSMILAFGKDTNGNFNQQAYVFDTKSLQWQAQFMPSASSSTPSSPNSPSETSISNTHVTTHPNPASLPTPDSSEAASSPSKTKIAVSTSIPLSILALASAAVLVIFLRRRRRQKRNTTRESHQRLIPQSYEMYAPASKFIPPRTPRRGHPSTRVFKRIFSRGKAHASPPPIPPVPMGVFLPAWAQEHARSSTTDSLHDEVVEDRMVQVASMSFMAPKMQLRVVNPDEDNEIDHDGSFRRRVSAGRQV